MIDIFLQVGERDEQEGIELWGVRGEGCDDLAEWSAREFGGKEGKGRTESTTASKRTFLGSVWRNSSIVLKFLNIPVRGILLGGGLRSKVRSLIQLGVTTRATTFRTIAHLSPSSPNAVAPTPRLPSTPMSA